MNSNFIKTNAVVQRRIFNLCTLERIDFRCFPGYPFKVLQNRASFEHFLNSIWTQKIIIDIIQAIRIFPLITFRPLLSIANGTYTSQIHSRNQISRISLLNQIRERKVRSIGMINVSSHYQRESSDTCRP